MVALGVCFVTTNRIYDKASSARRILKYIHQSDENYFEGEEVELGTRPPALT